MTTRHIGINTFRRLLTTGVCLMCVLMAHAQNTVVVGRVTDATSGKLMPYVNIVANTHERNVVGGVSDGDGHFNIQSPLGFDTLTFGFVGYETVRIAVKPHEWQNLSVEMHPTRIMLQEAVVTGKRERYRRRDNPAVELMRQVIAHKDSNSIRQLSHFSYRSHEKIELDLLGVKDTMRNEKTLQRLGFLFDGLQTSPISGQRFIPGFFVENIYEHRYRRTPPCEMRTLTGEKHIEITKFLEPQTIESALHDVFGDDIDIFDDKIHILDNEMVSPLADGATLLYLYYIDDTIAYEGDSCILLTFVPANPRDIGFSGTLLVSHDGRHALRRAHLELPEKCNINFVRSLEIEQRYAQEDGLLRITQNNMVMEGRFYGVPMRGRKELHYADYRQGAPAADSAYANNGVVTHAEGYSHRDDAWWDSHRIAPLSDNEQHTYEAARQLNELPFFRLSMNTMMAFATGYVDMGMWDYGPVESTLSWNDVEGVRLRVGGKTNTRLNKHWFANGFAAYGTKDHEWKYNAELMYSFREKEHHQWEFPAHLLTAGMEHNNDIPGQTFFMDSYDRFFRSLGGGSTDLMVMRHRYYAEYWLETKSHFSAKILLEHRTITPLAGLTGNFTSITTAAANLELRYARNETFYQSHRWRTTLNSTAPIVTLRYSYNAPLPGTDHDFSRLELVLQKKSYLWNLGFADITLQAGGIAGQAAYPLLFGHQANPGLFYQQDAFNMMNYLEFVSDRYAQVLFDYNFNGYLFNRIPLMRRLKWREVLAVKALWGGLSATNTPSDANGLPSFVTDSHGQPRIFTLDNGPYLEANIGIDNIFHLLRVDYVRRFTYLDHPHAARQGIRIRLHISF